jgi:glutathione synthase
LSSILFLISSHGVPRNDNHRRLPAAFAAHGWTVTVADHEALRVRNGQITIGGGLGGDVELTAFDRIWLVGMGERTSFLDRMQMLATLPPLKFVVGPGALLQLHAKYALPLGPLRDHHPETHASRDPAWLAGVVGRGGDWVAKPAAGSFGREVYRLRRDDPNLRVILDALTGHDASRYCVLQRYCVEIEGGEKRIIVAGGTVIDAYLRMPRQDHRANLAADAEARQTILTVEEHELAQRCAAWLAEQGVGFAAVDVAYPWIVEFNVANPGGLETIERLSGRDVSPAVVVAVAGGLSAATAAAAAR